MPTRAAHGEPGEPAEGKDLAPHEMQDVLPHFVDPPALPPALRHSVQKAEILMVPVHEQSCKRFLIEPVQPVLVLGAAVPQPAEVAGNDDIILAGHFFLLGKIFAAEPLEIAVGVACYIDHAAVLLTMARVSLYPAGAPNEVIQAHCTISPKGKQRFCGSDVLPGPGVRQGRVSGRLFQSVKSTESK